MSLDIEPGIFAAIDQDAMETVLRNLLENAVLYSDSSPAIRVSLSSDQNHCYLVFTDHGRGIEPNDQKKIFNIFYRVRRKNENIRGTGLGLFIVHANILRHHGQVTVESKGEGQGTTFRITLPLTQKAATTGAP